MLEDLGIHGRVFLDLQAVAGDELPIMTGSPSNTADFLECTDTAKATRVAYLIRKMGKSVERRISFDALDSKAALW